MSSFFSHGKLLITGEYVVLDSGLSLAIPTKKGQHMHVKTIASRPDKRILQWHAIDSDGNTWLQDEFDLIDGKLVGGIDASANVRSVLDKAIELNPSFLAEGSFAVQTNLEFPNNWGLGSSSTFICNVAKWAEVDAFELLNSSFGGSGYDIAVGMMGGDIIYRNPEMWEGFVYNPPFKDRLFFVHLNQKQDSREGIRQYRLKSKDQTVIDKITAITEELVFCKEFNRFQELITEHENILSAFLGLTPVKQQLFSDYRYAIKSLGAWGGDFILACGDEKTKSYFTDKGYETVVPYSVMAK